MLGEGMEGISCTGAIGLTRKSSELFSFASDPGTPSPRMLWQKATGAVFLLFILGISIS